MLVIHSPSVRRIYPRERQIEQTKARKERDMVGSLQGVCGIHTRLGHDADSLLDPVEFLKSIGKAQLSLAVLMHPP